MILFGIDLLTDIIVVVCFTCGVWGFAYHVLQHTGKHDVGEWKKMVLIVTALFSVLVWLMSIVYILGHVHRALF